MPKDKRPDFTRVCINSALKDSTHPELPVFYAYSFQQGLEVALTEYAARLCYNSFAKLGSSPNFVKKVLEHGHLSVAEHASFGIKRWAIGGSAVYAKNFLQAYKANRFFEATDWLAFGNMRFWIDYLSKVKYKPEFEVFLSIFPPAFLDNPMFKHFDVQVYSQQAPFFVAGGSGVNLLAVNFGDMLPLNPNTPPKEEIVGRFTWLIEGISRSCSHQIARHRGASISEQSMRYVDARKLGPQFIYPPDATEPQLAILKEQNESAFAKYTQLRESGMKAEDARFVMPLATETRMLLSFNIKELIHFLNVRCAKDAQWEVRNMARKMAWQAWVATNNPAIKQIMEKHGIEQWEGEGVAGS